jgi:hypothetical protein
MYYDSGLCGFLKTTQRIVTRKASLCEDLKFSSPIEHTQNERVNLPKHKLLLAKLNGISLFPDLSGYRGYRND